MLATKTILCLLVVLGIFHQTNGITFEDDTTLTKQQSNALQKFKARLVPKLKYDYQKEDMFLLRYLRAKQFDIKKAEDTVLTQMKWREDNKMETIHSEDWSDMEKEAPMRVSGVDRDGRPCVVWELGDWDLRKLSLAGKTDRAVRWTFKNWDEARIAVRELELQGKNVTRWSMMLDLSNINSVTNVNPSSFPYYIGASLGYGLHFPGMGDQIFLLNTPGLFETVLTLVRPGLDQETRDNLKVYGKNKEEWGIIVDAAIDPSERFKRYGGLKEDPN